MRSTGTQWNRKDVHQAIGQIASECGLRNITPRRLRSTVGHEMMLNGVRTNEISLILRHSAEATTARHYLHLQDLADARNILNSFHPVEAKIAQERENMNTSLIEKVQKCTLSCLKSASGWSISRIFNGTKATLQNNYNNAIKTFLARGNKYACLLPQVFGFCWQFYYTKQQ